MCERTTTDMGTAGGDRGGGTLYGVSRQGKLYQKHNRMCTLERDGKRHDIESADKEIETICRTMAECDVTQDERHRG